MTVSVTPWAIDGNTHPARDARRAVAGLLGSPIGSFTTSVNATTAGGGHGIVASTDFAVSQNGTPNMSVNVASGFAFVRGGESASQGCYEVSSTATVNLSIAAADATNPRDDLVIVQVRDAEYSGATRDARLFVVQGTPAASPSDPSLASTPNALVIARVRVAAGATTITNANITDLRTRAAGLGGLKVCTSTTRPSGASLFEGLTIYETDTDRVAVYDGGNWIRIGWTSSAGRTGFVLTTTTATTVTAATTTDLIPDGESFDSDGFWSSGATATIPATLGGLYAVTARVSWSTSALGTSPFARLVLGSTGYDANGLAAGSIHVVSATVALAGSSTMKVQAFQNSGVNVTAAVTLTAHRIGA